MSLALLGATAARAQEASGGAQPAAGDGKAQADAYARKVFAAGKAAYEIGNYQDALKYFQQAYELSGRSQLLYNVGQAADRMRYDETALAALKRYLKEQPSADNRQEVEERIRVLESVISAKQAQDAQMKEQANAGPVVVPPPAAVAEAAQPKAEPAVSPTDGQRDDSSVLSKWWLWAGAGVAVAAVVVTVIVVGGGTETKEREPFMGSNGKVTATLRTELR